MTSGMFFDTDCLSSFLWINNTNLLHELYGGKIVLPEPVYQELSNPRVPQLKGRADALIASGEEGKKCIGRGEAAGIALAKTYNGVIASNNYADIADYIQAYNLKHIDTGQILKEALEKGLITEMDGNSIWSQMLAKRRQLPTNIFSEYLKRQ